MTHAAAAPLLPLLRALLCAAVAGAITVVFVAVFALGYGAGHLKAWQEIGPPEILPLNLKNLSTES